MRRLTCCRPQSGAAYHNKPRRNRLSGKANPVARCTVERLMRRNGLRGVMRGKVVRTTISDPKTPCPLDRVNRQFKADRPNQLWVSDFTYVSTWQGWLYVAFVIDVFARRIVGWRVSSSMQTDFVLDTLEQALYARQPERDNTLAHHSDRGSHYVSIQYSERLDHQRENYEADESELLSGPKNPMTRSIFEPSGLNRTRSKPSGINGLP